MEKKIFFVCFLTYSRKQRGFRVGLLEPLSSLEFHGNIAQASNAPIPQIVLAGCWIPNAPFLTAKGGKLGEAAPAEGPLAEVGPGPAEIVAGGSEVEPALFKGPWLWLW